MPVGDISSTIELLIRADPQAAKNLRNELDNLQRSLDDLRAAGQTTGTAFHGTQAEFAATAAILAQVEAAEQKAAAASDALAGRTAWLDKQMKDLNDALRQTATVSATAEKAVSNQAATFQLTERQIGGISRGLLEFSRGLEDFSVAGWLGALNNIPGVVTSIGAAMKLTGAEINFVTAAVSILATATFVAYQHWEKLEDYFKIGIARPAVEGIEGLKDALEKAKKEMEGFEKQTRLSLSEFDEYDKAKEKVKGLNAELERQKALQDLLSGKSKAERDRASGFREAISETGGANARFDLIEALRDKADARGRVVDPTTNRDATPERAADNLLLAAAQGEKQARTQILDALRGAFRTDGTFATNIVAASPEEKVRKKALAERMESVQREDEEAMKLASDKTKALSDKFRQRVADAAEDVEGPIAGRRAAIAGARDAARSALPPGLFAGVEEAASDAERKLRLEAGREGKADDVAAARRRREREAAARAFTPTFQGQIQAEMAANQAKMNAGFPVARSARELQRLNAMGIDAAVPQEALKADLARRIGVDLGRGGNNPGLGREVVDQAMGKVAIQTTKLAGQQAATDSVLADNQAILGTLYQQAQGLAANAHAKALGVNGQLRRNAGRRPTLQRVGN